MNGKYLFEVNRLSAVVGRYSIRAYQTTTTTSNVHNFSSHDHHNDSTTATTNQAINNDHGGGKPRKLYRNLFPWQTDFDLAKCLASRIVYNGQNGLMIAINKPWGLGIHRPKQLLNTKNPSLAEQQLNERIFGQSNQSVSDVLDLLSQILQLPRLHIIKALDRKWSGLMLLSEDLTMERHVEKSIRRAKTMLLPYMRFYCIVNGIMNNVQLNQSYQERCGIRLTEIDELGTLKEPIYVSPKEMTKNMRKAGAHRSNRYQLGPVKPATVQYKVLATNPDLAVSLIDLHTTTTKWSMIQCFLAYKTSFVLGDSFFSHRVKHILGQPITMATLKQKRLDNWRHLDQNFEPLSRQVCEALGVRGNREIPLMIHHHGLVLPSLLKSVPRLKPNGGQAEVLNPSNDNDNRDDLVIEANRWEHLPEHFRQTLLRLGLNQTAVFD